MVFKKILWIRLIRGIVKIFLDSMAHEAQNIFRNYKKNLGETTLRYTCILFKYISLIIVIHVHNNTDKIVHTYIMHKVHTGHCTCK